MSGYAYIELMLKNYKMIVLNVRFIHFNKLIVISIYEKLLRIAIIRLICIDVSLGGVSLLQDLLSEDNVSFHYPAETWEEVIRHGGQLMVDAGFTDPSYTEAMVEVVREMGPYIVLAPGLAMPHARPEHGANE